MTTFRALAWLLLAAGPMLGCKDLTAPDGGVALLVTPDTLVPQVTFVPPGILVNFHIRNVNSYVVAVSPCTPELEKETAPDVWETIRAEDQCFLEPLPAGTWRPLVAYLGPTPPGRYRFRTSFTVPDSRGVSLTDAKMYSQVSNAFVVKVGGGR